MIKTVNVSKTFYETPVLHRISFEVEQGQSYVILGQSGIGKSVLLKILAHLIVPDEGYVEINTRNIAMVFQKNALFDSSTVFENLDFPLRERTSLSPKERKIRIEKFLDWVGLAQSLSNLPSELSGGMQKRLGIARALIVEPEVIFYDEPTAGLDPITSRVISELILRLKKELGSTIVTVTSDVMRAYQIADKIALLRPTADGASLLESGTPAEAKVSNEPSIKQFLNGLTVGPLTEKDLGPRASEYEKNVNLLERYDVDFF